MEPVNNDILQWALLFLVLAIISALFGFGGAAIASVKIGRILFGLFIVLSLASAIIHFKRRRTKET